MEVNFCNYGTDVRLNVPVHGELTIHINPVGGLVPQIDGRLYVNGSRVYPQASGGFTININPVGLLVPPPQAGDVKLPEHEKHEPENPKLPYQSLGMVNPKVFFDMTVCAQTYWSDRDGALCRHDPTDGREFPRPLYWRERHGEAW
ncbi:Peptidyl-prolyl cis-trans isomerase [Raphanus sativus]|nr:Peptidyl-prolyl cis-trans isomerase [Raphanus sativus]